MDTEPNKSQPHNAHAMATESSRYMQAPLDLAKDQIRLLRILRQDSHQVHCTLETFDRSSKPSYIAVSYAWGSRLDAENIYIDGGTYTVTRNLYDFLQVITRQSLGNENIFTSDYMGHDVQCKDYSAPDTLFWIDQICIDQDNVSEKNHQVRQMGDIFREAESVLSWLGPESEDSDAAMKLVSQIGYYDLARLDDAYERYEESIRQITGAYASITALLSRKYWSRVWIAQEVVLATRVQLLCGRRIIPWRSLEHFSPLFIDSKAQLSPRIFPCKALVDIKESGCHLSDPSVIIPLAPLECENPRDKIYGLLAISGLERHIEINYSKNSAELFWEWLIVAKDDKVQFSRRSMNLQFYANLNRLAECMGVASLELQEKIMAKWGVNISRKPSSPA